MSALDSPAIELDHSKYSRIGWFVIVVILGGFVVWGTHAPIDGAAVAQGVVVVQSDRKPVQHLEGGIVERVWVRDGDRVTQGEVLVQLQASDLQAAQESLSAQELALLARLNRVEAEVAQRGEVDFDPMLAQSDLGRSARSDQASVFKAQREELLASLRLIDQQQAQAEARLEGLALDISSRESVLTSFNNELERARRLVSGGFQDQATVQELERAVLSASNQLSSVQNERDVLRLRLRELEAQRAQYTQSYISTADRDRAQTRLQLNDVRTRLGAINAQLARTQIVAPQDGIILGNQVRGAGSVIRPGEVLMEIVPVGDQLRVEAEVMVQDIDRVGFNQLADLRFSAFNSSTTPVIQGNVIDVSADRMVNSNTGMPYYKALIQVAPEEMELLEGQTLIPGMPVDVMIQTGQRTLWQYLMKPVTDAAARSLRED